MDQQKARTYLLYALGEIFLVVIGILIALQVNNWNEERISRNDEAFYLEKIEDALRSDSLRLNRLIGLGDQMITMLDSASIMMKSPELYSEEEFRSQLLALVMINEFSPNRSVFDNLNATGEIKIFQDQELVDELYTYYNTNTEIGVRQYARNEFTPFMMRFDEISYEKLDRMITVYPEGVKEYHSEGKSINEYKADPFFTNALKIKSSQLYFQNDGFRQLTQAITRIMNLIELNKER